MEVEKRNKGVITVSMSYQVGWEQWFLLSSDRHHDNPHTKWDLEKKHLEEAIKKDAYILDFGDLFCAMQGKYDRRSSKDDLRQIHKKGSYLDKLVETASDFYAPYSKRWICMGMGNHETAILSHHETNLTERLVSQLNITTNSNIINGGYSGWIQFKFRRSNGGGFSYNMYYHHGHGGGGVVTKGVIQTNRRAVYLPDANFVVSGHIHEEWTVTQQRLRLTQKGRQYLDEQIHICLPTYKEEFLPSQEYGFHTERGRPPKPLGAKWLRFYYDVRSTDGTKPIKYQIIRAK